MELLIRGFFHFSFPQVGWQLEPGILAGRTLVALGRRRWRRTGRRDMAVLRRLRLQRLLRPVGARLRLGERLQLSSLRRLRLLLITNCLIRGFFGPGFTIAWPFLLRRAR